MSAGVLRSLLRAASALGLEVGPVADELGLDEHALGERTTRLPEAIGGRMWERLERESGDPTFGLRIGQALDADEDTVMGYLCRSSATLGEALRCLADHASVLAESLRVSVHPERERVRIRVETGEWTDHHLREALLAMFVLRARRFTGRPLSPREVRFRHPKPPDLSVHRRVFGGTPLFMQRADELVVDRSALELPLRTADPILRDILLAFMRRFLERSPIHDGLQERLRRTIEEGLRTRDVGLAAVATRVHLSPRTLQRRLSSQGTSLQALVDETRRDLALRLLESDVPIAEAAYLLGFSEPSAFHRAFKRWTGQTPAQLRGRKGD